MTLEELYRLLRTSHVQAQGIVDTLQEPLVVLDKNLTVIAANPSFYRIFRTEADNTLGRSLFELGNGQWDIPELRQLLFNVVPKAAAVIAYEVTHNFPDLGRRTIHVSARQLVHPDENSTQLLLVFDDVTQQKKIDAAKDILAAETQHRMKNLIAVMRSIVRRADAKNMTGEEYRDVLLARIEVVLDAQEFASRGTSADLAVLIRETLERTAGRRATVGPGPSVSLAPFQILPATLILHELATNAFKYGALSNDTGMVRVNWRTEPRDSQTHLILDWREEGGPAVSVPKHQGFGTHLVQFSARAEGGSAVLDFAPAGLHVQIELPVTKQT
jgi:two-component sensor histidine kinase